jgi:hypothetical protein
MRQALEQGVVQLLPTLVAVLGGLLCALIGYAITYLKSKTTNTKVLGALDRLDQVSEDAVKDAQQRVIGSLKPGDNMNQVLAEAKTSAIDSVKSHYGEKGIEELKKVLGWEDADKNLSTKIEAKVHDLKLERINVPDSAPLKPAA